MGNQRQGDLDGTGPDFNAISGGNNRVKNLLKKTLLYHGWEEFRFRYYWKYVLPKMKEVEIEGIRLDVSNLPVKVRNRILNGGYESHEMRMCRDFLGPEDSVLELGGAIGFIGLYCQKKIGIQRYVSFEANPRTLEILKKNYRLNECEPVVWNLALASQDGAVELDVEGDFWENSIVSRAQPGAGSKTMKVPAASLQTILNKVSHPVNVLIIDIEGAEKFIDFDAIPGGIEKIIIEFHPGIIGTETMYEIIARLVVKGFRVAREEEGTFVFLQGKQDRAPASRQAQVAGDGQADRVAPGTPEPDLAALGSKNR
jgi:FkbM family methyltransferase